MNIEPNQNLKGRAVAGDFIRHSTFVARHLVRPAFTFVEVLFAIIILGIGMIMLAAMLPVAISQTAQVRDQVAGKAAAEAGYAYVKAVARSGGTLAFPATVNPPGGGNPAPAGFMQPATAINTGQLVTPPGLNQYKLSRIMSSDPTVQWIPFYRRDLNSNVVKVVVLATRLTATEQAAGYDASTIGKETELANATSDPSPATSSNGPHLFAVKVVEGGADADRLQFFSESSRGTPVDPEMAAPGTYVIIREQNSNNIVSTDAQVTFRNNGRVFRLSSKVEGQVGVWELSPGFDLPPVGLGPDGINGTTDDVTDLTLDPSAPNDRATAWIVGKASTDPVGGANTYSGVTQDIGLLKFDMTVN